ncbi:MAG: CAP domain-containing protein [Verrucomicrobia bacterium]|nr:CAP domain-containing protein [Verrucomicrobiota bacterium]
MPRFPVLPCVLAAALLAPAARTAEPAAAADAGPVFHTSATPAQLEAAIFAETNRIRRTCGRRPLRPLPELAAAAADQASYMALTHRAEHQNVLRDQGDVLERVLRHGLRPAEVAENVASLPAVHDGRAATAAEMAASLVEAWMHSPGHRENLLSRRFTHLGCAARVVTALGRTEYVFGAQVFASLPSNLTE